RRGARPAPFDRRPAERRCRRHPLRPHQRQGSEGSMMMRYRTAALGAAVFLAGIPRLAGQGTPVAPAAVRPLRDTTIVTDRVIALFANRPILLSQVDEEIFTRQSQA